MGMKNTVALLAGVIWLVLSQSGAAFAATSGAQDWVIVSRSGQPNRVGAYGVINTTGTVVDHLNLNPATGSFDNVATQTFPAGTLAYHGVGTATLQIDPRTCIGTGHIVSEHFAITGGTGAYQGASGTGTATGDLGFLFTPTATGCSQVPAESWGVDRAVGTLTLP